MLDVYGPWLVSPNYFRRLKNMKIMFLKENENKPQKTFIGSLCHDLKKYSIDPREYLALKNVLPNLWAETFKVFELVFEKLPVHRYFTDDETMKLKLLSYPHSQTESFYGLKKKLMPLPAYFVMYPPLRYVPFDFVGFGDFP